MASKRRLESELKKLHECDSFSHFNVTENEEESCLIKWMVEVDQLSNTKGQLKIEFSFPRNLISL
jgi:hypothetical protein